MRRAFLLTMTLALALPAIEYGDRSTQELIAAMKHVKEYNRKALLDELAKRLPTMSKKEKTRYGQNLKLLKQGDGR